VGQSPSTALPVGSQPERPSAVLASVSVLGIAITALLLASLGWPFPSNSAAKWCAVGLVLLAFVGRRRRDAAILVAVLTVLAGSYIAGDALLRLGEGAPRAGWIYVAGGLVFAAPAVVWLARGMRTPRPLDPVVVIAVQLGVALFAHWFYDLISGVGLNPNAYSAESWGTPFAAELPNLALGLAGVGFLVYRGPASSLGRLGMVRPTSWQISAALIASVVAVGVSAVANRLTYVLMPHAYDAINAITDKTSGQSPFEVLLVYAVLAGIGEETVFRGALQPRVGIVITALLFTMIHVQYGVTPILGAVFVSGLVFGWLRQRMNTTTAIIAHGMTDGLPLMFAAFGVLALVALMIVICLLAVHAENGRWPRSVWALASATALIVVGSVASFYAISSVAWKIGALAGCAVMAIAILLEVRALRSGLFAVAGVGGWLVVASIVAWSPTTGGFALFAVFLIAATAGVGVWYKLASSNDAGATEVAG